VARPVVGHLVAVEQPPDDPDGLVEPLEPLAGAGLELDPVGLVLQAEPGAAKAEDRAAAADVVEGDRLLGDQGRVAEGVGGAERAEAHPARCTWPTPPASPPVEDRLVGVAEEVGRDPASLRVAVHVWGRRRWVAPGPARQDRLAEYAGLGVDRVVVQGFSAVLRPGDLDSLVEDCAVVGLLEEPASGVGDG